MKRYDSYKDSGVQWIGEIPSHWSVPNLSYLLIGVTDGTHGTHERVSKGELLLSSKNVTNHGIVIGSNESQISFEDHNLIVKKGYPIKGDILITVVGSIGRSCVYEFDYPISFQRSVCFLRFRNTICEYFMNFLIQSDIVQYQFFLNTKTSTQGGIYMNDLKRFVVVIPPLSEQHQIVSFLDSKTSQIDELIQKKERKIELLKEYRTSLINHFVTKGLNPNVELKDSGVEWIGEIPSHWGTTKIKYTTDGSKYSFIDGDWIESNNLSDDGIRYITTGNIGEGFYKEQGKGYISEETFNNLNCTEVLEGDLVISRLSLPVGRSCIIPFIHHKVVTSVDNVILRPTSEFSKHYLNYQFNSKKYFDYTELISRGTTLTRISRGMLGNNPIVSPPLSDQQQIVSYLDEQTEKIDSSIQLEKKKIELLKEYRQSLISEVVTGKMKVF